MSSSGQSSSQTKRELLLKAVAVDLDGTLIGGVYGVTLGRVFFGESMFSAARDGSKIALAHLCTMDYHLIDCQLPNEHLFRLGAVLITREAFADHLARWCSDPLSPIAMGSER